MEDASTGSDAVRDPLAAETRKQRRNLILVSGIGLALVKLGIVPTKIQALGVELSAGDRSNLLVGVFLVVLYFLASFLVYAVSDAAAWLVTSGRWRTEMEDEIARATARAEREFEELYVGGLPPSELEKREREIAEGIVRVGVRLSPLRMLYRASLLRVLFDLVLPLVIAAYASFELVRAF